MKFRSVTAQELRRLSTAYRMRHLAVQTIQLAALADRAGVVEHWPARLNGLISDARLRPAVLGGIALALGEEGRTDAALDALRLALASARSIGFESTAAAVTDGMAALTAGPGGVSVREIYDMVEEIESWLGLA